MSWGVAPAAPASPRVRRDCSAEIASAGVANGEILGAQAQNHGAARAEFGVDGCRDFFSQLGVAVEHGHLGAQAGQFACGGLAEARCAAGHEGGLSLNLHGVCPWVLGVKRRA